MNIGHASLCLNVQDIQQTFDFYTKLGFSVHEKHLEQGWVILYHRHFYLGLFQGHITENMINFRGGHIASLKEWMDKVGITIEKVESIHENGSGSFFIRDPDGNSIYFDTTPEELETDKQ
jgi:catechol 2,3-dioxygenase-like lactoylglutathione lyase family enzyme